MLAWHFFQKRENNFNTTSKSSEIIFINQTLFQKQYKTFFFTNCPWEFHRVLRFFGGALEEGLELEAFLGRNKKGKMGRKMTILVWSVFFVILEFIQFGTLTICPTFLLIFYWVYWGCILFLFLGASWNEEMGKK